MEQLISLMRRNPSNHGSKYSDSGSSLLPHLTTKKIGLWSTLWIVLFILLLLYFLLVMGIAALMQFFPYDTPQSTWIALQCDQLSHSFYKLSSPTQTIHTFHADCMTLRNIQFPLCQSVTPDGRFANWKHWNRTLSLEDPFEILFPLAHGSSLSSHTENHKHSDQDTLELVHIPWDKIQTDVPGRRDICYLGDFHQLVHFVEYDYLMDNDFEVRELHLHMTPPEGIQAAPMDVVFHYGLSEDEQSLMFVGTAGMFYTGMNYLGLLTLLIFSFDMILTYVWYQETHWLCRLKCWKTKEKKDDEVDLEKGEEMQTLL